MEITTTKKDGVVQIRLPATFSFSNRKEFLETYKDNPPNTRYCLDFSRVERLDSSTLGMLLIMREHNGEKQEDISFINCSRGIETVFGVTNFNKLFNIV